MYAKKHSTSSGIESLSYSQNLRATRQVMELMDQVPLSASNKVCFIHIQRNSLSYLVTNHDNYNMRNVLINLLLKTAIKMSAT